MSTSLGRERIWLYDAATMRIILRGLLTLLVFSPAAALAGDRLLVTGGAQQLEGAAGGGLVPWALIAGYGTRDQVGGSVFITRVHTQDFRVDSYGAAVGLFDRVELSAARQSLDAGSVIPGLELRMQTLGAKVRIFGDALYDQDSPWPQLALGLQYKKNLDMEIPSAIGATRDSDTDFYLAATKVWLAGVAGRNLVGNLTLRATRANQLGFLGFGGDREDSRRLQAEASLAVLINDQLVRGRGVSLEARQPLRVPRRRFRRCLRGVVSEQVRRGHSGLGAAGQCGREVGAERGVPFVPAHPLSGVPVRDVWRGVAVTVLALLPIPSFLLFACATTPAPSLERVQIVTAGKSGQCKSLGTFTVIQRGGPDKPGAALTQALKEVSRRGGNGMLVISNSVDWEQGAAMTAEALQCQF